MARRQFGGRPALFNEKTSELPSIMPPETQAMEQSRPMARDPRLRGIANLRRHVADGVLVTSAFQLGVVGLSALRGLIVAAFISSSDYGLWGLIGFTLWAALGLKTQFGANDKYIQQSDENQEHAFQRAFTVELIFVAAAAPVAAGIAVMFTVVSGQAAVLAPSLALLLLLPSTALQFPLATFYRQLDYRRLRRLQAVDPIVGFVVTLVLALLGAGYWSFVGGALAGSWGNAIVALRAAPYRLAWRYERGTLRTYVGFSAPLLITALSVLGLFQVIYLTGASALGLAGLGAFTLVGNLVQFTDQADSIVTQTMYPAVCAVRDRITLLAEIFVKSNRLSLMWAVPFGVGMALFGGDLVHYGLGNKWAPAIPVLEIMGLVTAVHHVGYNWAAFLKARGITWPIAIQAVTVTVVVLGAGIPLMYSDGILGLAYAFAIGEAVGLVTRGYLLSRFFNGVRILPHLLRAFAPTVVAAVPVLCLRAAIGPEHGGGAAIAVFAFYVALTVVATFAIERPLLAEAFGYISRRVRTAPAVAGAG
jgi:O-antigen/teichoic acid export membrane protein